MSVNAERRITYIGPGISGRRESLSLVLRHFVPNATRVLDNLDRSFHVRSAPLVAAVATKRALYLDATGPTGPGLLEESDRVADSSAFVFVVDSQPERVEAGLEQLRLLRDDLARRSIDLDEIPVVFQLNKRDLNNVVPAADLQNAFKAGRCRYIESIATQGRGVVEAFETVLAMIERS